MMIIRHLGLVNYATCLARMQAHTTTALPSTLDELWLCEHPPVYTLGRHYQSPPFHNPWHIPVIQSDRGGKITYHGPGQCIAYCLINLKQLKKGPREFVCQLETILIQLLRRYDISANRRVGAPGIYVGQAKIASLGLRIKNGRAYHGLSLNVNMDLQPFNGIDPCGYADLKMVNMIDYAHFVEMPIIQRQLSELYLSSLTDPEATHVNCFNT